MTQELNKERFEELLHGGEPLLVEYHAPWCGYCRRLEPAFARVAQEYAQVLTPVKIDIDKEPALSDEEHIEVVPTLVLYRGGRSVGSIVAPGSAGEIRRFLDEALGS